MKTCTGCSNEDISIQHLPCSHTICTRCLGDQAVLMPKVFELNYFVCHGCGLRYSLGKHIRDTFSQSVPKLDLSSFQVYIPILEAPGKAANCSIDQFEEEMGPHLQARSRDDLTAMTSPKDPVKYMTPRHQQVYVRCEEIDTANNSMREVSEGGCSSRSNLPSNERYLNIHEIADSQSIINQKCSHMVYNMNWQIPSFPDNTKHIYTERPSLGKSKAKLPIKEANLKFKHTQISNTKLTNEKPKKNSQDRQNMPERPISITHPDKFPSKPDLVNKGKFIDHKTSPTLKNIDNLDDIEFIKRTDTEQMTDGLTEVSCEDQIENNLQSDSFLDEKNDNLRDFGRDMRKLKTCDIGTSYEKACVSRYGVTRNVDNTEAKDKNTDNLKVASCKYSSITFEVLRRKAEHRNSVNGYYLSMKNSHTMNNSMLYSHDTIKRLGISELQKYQSRTSQIGSIEVFSSQNKVSNIEEGTINYLSKENNKSWQTEFSNFKELIQARFENNQESTHLFNNKSQNFNQNSFTDFKNRNTDLFSKTNSKLKYLDDKSESQADSPIRINSLAVHEHNHRRTSSGTFEASHGSMAVGRHRTTHEAGMSAAIRQQPSDSRRGARGRSRLIADMIDDFVRHGK